ncbi:MAG TPA: cupin domain-containing protein [Armatimonadetes bacterium]|jgi:mannose-6-phosphate isomerase-like protein (cupin superfamily)|nr:cupin domain-containing protein [Armatimonadota bacterium]
MKRFSLPERLEASGDKAFDVVAETEQSQAAVFVLPPGADTGLSEGHEGDQILYIASGEGEVQVGDEVMECHDGDVVLIPAGERHDVRNRGGEPLRMLSIYAPPIY